MNPRRKQIIQDALLQLRATREALGPEMMARLQILVRDFNPEYLQAADAMAEEEKVGDAFEPVDRRKNLMIVMKFLHMKQGDKGVHDKIRAIMSEAGTIQ